VKDLGALELAEALEAGAVPELRSLDMRGNVGVLWHGRRKLADSARALALEIGW
jgi:hypothetical protein